MNRLHLPHPDAITRGLLLDLALVVLDIAFMVLLFAYLVNAAGWAL
ncbi:hypothetical protein [Mycobacterium sp. NS-7484]|nr:hypothetical protein [Mycobacterium sp. NS-7484]